MDSDPPGFFSPTSSRQLPTPRITVPGIGWPAIASGNDAVVLALLQQLELTQWAPPDTLLALQMRQLELLLGHAAQKSAFYRERLAPLHGIRRGGLTPELLRRVPPLRRRDLQDASDTIVCGSLPKGHGKAFDVVTSGSTGTPVRTKGTQITGLFLAVLNMRLHIWHNRDFSATVGAIQVLKPKQAEAAAAKKSVPWASTFGRGQMFHCDVRRKIDDQLAWLMDVDPDYLLIYPSNVLALVDRAQETGARTTNLKHVATLGEIVTDTHRDRVREGWGVSIIDTYSSQELGIMALQCPDHEHHLVQAESVYVEVLDDSGAPCPPGSVGRVVVTNLHNFASPLIRYEIGDHAEVGGACPTGRGLPVLNRILGRTRNMLTLPDGGRMWPGIRYGILAQRFGYRQIQLVQHTREEIEVRFVVDTPFDADTEDALRRALVDEIGHPMTFRFTYVDAIPKTPNGKYEDFRSEVSG